MTLEKIIKAHICRYTQKLAPRIHNLVRLAELAKLHLNEEQIDLIAEVNEFNIEGRYPELLLPPPSQIEADLYIRNISEVMQCLNTQL